jgi:hypothetical protein
MFSSERADTYRGKGPKRVLSWEHFSDPDAATFITGVDYYKAPRECMQKLSEKYPFILFGIPESNDPIIRPEDQGEGKFGRWGAENREYWQQELTAHRFRTEEEIKNFSPLEQCDFTGWNIVEDTNGGDFSSTEIIYDRYIKMYQDADGNLLEKKPDSLVGFYNTMFMWPLLTFGYERFLTYCMEDWFGRIMDEFAEINRRVFTAFARLPVNFAVCHDDIVLPTGPVCSPEWMNKYIFPRYEEYWSILKGAGIETIFMADGNVDAFADDIMTCGALGIISEPYTNFRSIAKRYKDPFIAGEGDIRILMRNDKDEIRDMVRRMVETSKMSSGYMMCIGNHIPYNVSPESVKFYFDLCAELAYR